MRTLLRHIGLRSPRQTAWALYDWANSAFVTSVVTTLFPIYFLEVAGADLSKPVAMARFAMATTLALGIVALLAPVLGTIADTAAVKKKMLGLFLVVGAGATAGLALVGPGAWLPALALFVVANVGASCSFVFYDALLPHVARRDELDRVSAAGYALGYLGGGLLLAVHLLWILRPGMFGFADASEASRAAFLSVAVWWAAFSIPLFLRVPEPPATRGLDERPRHVVRVSLRRLGTTLRHLRLYRHAFLFLLAFLVYNDGIGTIIRMATAYGREIGIGRGALVGAILLVQFVGIPFAFLFGRLGSRLGPKRAISICLVVYSGICVFGYFMTTAAHFFVLAVLVATVQGGAQALSRSLFARMIPAARSAEFFGFFAVFERFAAILGPAVFMAAIVMTGTSRTAILAIIAFFVVGGTLLLFVDVEAGERQSVVSDQS